MTPLICFALLFGAPTCDSTIDLGNGYKTKLVQHAIEDCEWITTLDKPQGTRFIMRVTVARKKVACPEVPEEPILIIDNELPR